MSESNERERKIKTDNVKSDTGEDEQRLATGSLQGKRQSKRASTKREQGRKKERGNERALGFPVHTISAKGQWSMLLLGSGDLVHSLMA